MANENEEIAGEHSLAEALQPVINTVPQQGQTQASLQEQLRVLQAIAHKFGLYDAADAVGRSLTVTRP